jgi:hypothetical protein
MKLSFFESLLGNIYCKKKGPKRQLLDNAIKFIISKLDVVNVIKSLLEIKKLKYLIFTNNQCNLIDHCKKYDFNSENKFHEYVLKTEEEEEEFNLNHALHQIALEADLTSKKLNELYSDI